MRMKSFRPAKIKYSSILHAVSYRNAMLLKDSKRFQSLGALTEDVCR